jgi:hypothetical protein
MVLVNAGREMRIGFLNIPQSNQVGFLVRVMLLLQNASSIIAGETTRPVLPFMSIDVTCLDS